MSTPTTFEAHGQIWTKHIPGDPMPCESHADVIVLWREELDSDKAGFCSDLAKGWCWSALPHMAGKEIIGWRYADATPPQEKDELKIPDHLAEKLKAHVGAPSELARLREIVAACMKAMPCGNIATHTPENLAGRIGELAQALAAESLENDTLRKENASMLKASQDATASHIIDKVLWESEMEKLTALSAHRLALYDTAIAENASMRTAIKEGHTALEKVYLAYCSTTADVEDCGIDNIARDALATLSPFTESK